MEFSVENWHEHECVRNRPAVERDVQEGRATFYVPETTASDVYPIECPAPAILTVDESKRVSVIVVQAQHVKDTVAVGLMDQNGNHYVSTIDEVEIFDEATPEWLLGLEATE